MNVYVRLIVGVFGNIRDLLLITRLWLPYFLQNYCEIQDRWKNSFEHYYFRKSENLKTWKYWKMCFKMSGIWNLELWIWNLQLWEFGMSELRNFEAWTLWQLVILKSWNFAILQSCNWNLGNFATLKLWNFRTLERWNFGTLKLWYFET